MIKPIPPLVRYLKLKRLNNVFCEIKLLHFSAKILFLVKLNPLN